MRGQIPLRHSLSAALSTLFSSIFSLPSFQWHDSSGIWASATDWGGCRPNGIDMIKQTVIGNKWFFNIILAKGTCSKIVYAEKTLRLALITE